MDSFYRTTGSSPPKEHHDNSVGPDPRSGEPKDVRPLPEELVEALAALRAEALVNDIRQYPDLRDLTPDGAPVAAPFGADTSPQQSAGDRHASTRSRTRRPAHAS